MFLQYWQIEAAFKAAKQQPTGSLVGTRVNYQFFHDTADGKNNGICGLFGWIYEHKNPGDPVTVPMELTIAFETTIDEFYVTQEGIRAVFAREQLAGDSTSINQFDRAAEIDDTVYGPEK